MNNEPLGKKYKRLMDSFERHKGSLEEQAKRFAKNPKEELEKIKAHNKEISQIWNDMVTRNNKGIKFEKENKIECAIKLYEQNVSDEFSGTHPYDRLMIIYRRRKQLNDEIRIIENTIRIFEGMDDRGYLSYILKLKERLKKAKKLKMKQEGSL